MRFKPLAIALLGLTLTLGPVANQHANAVKTSQAELDRAVAAAEIFWRKDKNIEKCRGKVKAKWTGLKSGVLGQTTQGGCNTLSISSSAYAGSAPRWKMCGTVVHEYGHALGHVARGEKNSDGDGHSTSRSSIMYFADVGQHLKVCDYKGLKPPAGSGEKGGGKGGDKDTDTTGGPICPAPGEDGDGASGGGDAAGGGKVSGDVQELAKQILASKNASFTFDTVSPNGSTREVLKTMASGKKAYVTCGGRGKSVDVNPNILKFLVEALKEGRVGINAITDKCHSNGSKHYSGEAVDLDLNSPSVSKLNAIAKKYGGTKNSEGTHHHYDFPK